jgi:hypothetical protein
MSEDLKRILESKRALRRSLASRPVAEKLRMLDDLRQRELAIRHAASHQKAESSVLREATGEYRGGEERKK